MGLLASAGSVFVAGMSTSVGVEAIVQEQTEQQDWDVDVQLASPASLDEIVSLLEDVPHLSRVEGFNAAQTGVSAAGQIPVTRTYPDQGHGRVSVITVPSGTTMFTTPELLEGRWLEPGETGAVVLNQVARNNTLPDLRAGDSVQLSVAGQPTTWRVVGLPRNGAAAAAYTPPPRASRPPWASQSR